MYICRFLNNCILQFMKQGGKPQTVTEATVIKNELEGFL